MLVTIPSPNDLPSCRRLSHQQISDCPTCTLSCLRQTRQTSLPLPVTNTKSTPLLRTYTYTYEDKNDSARPSTVDEHIANLDLDPAIMDVASINGSSSTSKISKLLPKKLAARRLRRGHSSGDSLDSIAATSEDGHRGRSSSSRDPFARNGNGNDNSNGTASFSTSHGSEPSLIDDDDGDDDGDDAEAALSPFGYDDDYAL